MFNRSQTANFDVSVQARDNDVPNEKWRTFAERDNVTLEAAREFATHCLVSELTMRPHLKGIREFRLKLWEQGTFNELRVEAVA